MYTTLPRNTNQALGIGEYAIEFLKKNKESNYKLIDSSVYDKINLFHADSVVCGLSAIALKTNAPRVLREEAEEDYSSKTPNKTYPCSLFSKPNVYVRPEKAVVANSAAVREWDSNGTVFGWNDRLKGHNAGEFGHNDFYPVVIAAMEYADQQKNVNIDLSGKFFLTACVLIDEIRGRLSEVYSLKTFKIDHVVHGAIASAAVFGAIVGATAKQIESAIGMVVAHYIPYRAIRAGKQLSDSKGSSAAVSSEVAVLSILRSMRGFIGPADIFRNPESIFCLYPSASPSHESSNTGDAPFDLVLTNSGEDFSVMGMHFKLGLYEHQSASAIHAILIILSQVKLSKIDHIKEIKVLCYEPAFGIIGDPAKRNPQSRQSADHSMVFILSRILKKAINFYQENPSCPTMSIIDIWKKFMLDPYDYGITALKDDETRAIMDKIVFEHGGPQYDEKYPEGIPTSASIYLTREIDGVSNIELPIIMFPPGHAKTEVDFKEILLHKFKILSNIAFGKTDCVEKLMKIGEMDSVCGIYQSFDGLVDNLSPIDG